MSSARPKYLVIPIEDVDFDSADMAQRFPIYRLPALARQVRMAQEEDSFQIAPRQYEPEVASRLDTILYNQKYIPKLL